MTRRGHRLGASCGLRVPRLVCLRLDPNENGAPEGVKLSRAGALGAAQFAFEALDRGLRSELCDELLDAAAESAREDALLLHQGRGREVAVASDLGHACRRLEGLKVISPAAEKSTLGWLRAVNRRSRMRSSSPIARSHAKKRKQRLAVEGSGTPVAVEPHSDSPESVDQAGAKKSREQVRLRGACVRHRCVFDGMPRRRKRAWIRRPSFGLMRRSLAISRLPPSAAYRHPSASCAFARPSVRGGRGT